MSLSLALAVSSSDTTLVMSNVIENVSGGGLIQIENEYISFSSASDNRFLGCTRGSAGSTAASHARNKGVTLVGLVPVVNATSTPDYITEEYGDRHSHQSDAADLTLDAKVGSNDATNPKFLAASMWNVFGDALAKTANYIAGVIGAYSITGTKASTYPTGAVLAQISDGVTEADGAVVAYIDGDSSQTKANAAFKVMHNNSNAGSGFHWGMDFKSQHDGYNPVAFLDGEIRLSNGTKITVSGDTIVFTNDAGDKSATITMS